MRILLLLIISVAVSNYTKAAVFPTSDTLNCLVAERDNKRFEFFKDRGITVWDSTGKKTSGWLTKITADSISLMAFKKRNTVVTTIAIADIHQAQPKSRNTIKNFAYLLLLSMLLSLIGIVGIIATSFTGAGVLVFFGVLILASILYYGSIFGLIITPIRDRVQRKTVYGNWIFKGGVAKQNPKWLKRGK